MNRTSERTKLVLIADGDPEVRDILGYVMDDFLSFRALTAGDGEAALATMRQDLPDLILLDVGLPKSGGARFLRQLRSAGATRDIPVIALNSSGHPDQHLWARQVGCVACLDEPFDLDELVLTIKAHV